MRAADLLRTLELVTFRGAAELDIIGRELRKFQMLPKGGRGLNAPALSAQDVATVLIGMAGAANANAAARAVLDIAPLQPAGGLRASFRATETFADALAFALAHGDAARMVETVRICQSTPAASIAWNERGERRVALYQPDKVNKEGLTVGAGSCLVWTEIPGAVLHQLAIDLEDGEVEGEIVAEWTAELRG